MNIIPENDEQRVAVLKRYRILDTPPEDAFDHIARLAVQIFDVPVALISLVDTDQVFFKANIGMGKIRQTGRGQSLCSLAILQPEVTVFENALNEPCLIANPLVAGSFGLKFYAGAPLITHDGYLIGTLCLVGKEPRTFTAQEKLILQNLARVVMDQIELRLAALNEHDHQQEINRKLIASEQKAQAIIADAPVAIAVFTGSNMVVESANTRMLEVWDKTPAVIGLPLALALPEIEGQPFSQLLGDVFTAGAPLHDNEIRTLLRRNGALQEVYLNFVYHPLKAANGAVTGVMAVGIEVTEQVNSRQELEIAEERMRLAITSAQMGLWSINHPGLHLSTDATTRALLGYHNAANITLQHITDAMPAEYQRQFRALLDKAVETGELFDIEYPVNNAKAGETKWVKFIGKASYNEKGVPVNIKGLVMDITERKQDEQRMSDFLSMVSHDLRSPLTTVKSFTQLLQKRAQKAEEEFAISALGKIDAQVNKMNRMIKGFLDTGRLQSGKINLEKEEFNISALLQEVIDELHLIAGRHIVEVYTCDEVTITADRDKLAQVLTNFIGNAIKYSPEGGRVIINCRSNDNELNVSVTDQGIGISPKNLERMFERFYRVESDRMKTIKGFGIGLYLSGEIIASHKGRVWVESEEGRGSAFYFSLPLL